MNTKAIYAIRTIARRQHGCFTLQQALAAGWTWPTVHKWIAAGVWEEPRPRVYRFAGVPMRWDDELFALALSAKAIAARRSANALYGLLSPPQEPRVLV